ncbi:MAG: acyloxyacyl hydrolase [Saprospiraceae bacterium]|nr:acyloxyacyl hydrolase [Saprospiraceae bacterium]
MSSSLSSKCQIAGTGSIQMVHLRPHTQSFLFKPKGIGVWIQAGLEYQTRGTLAWHREYGYPRLGARINIMHLGHPFEILGMAYSIIPYVDFGLKHFGEQSLRLIVGSGLSYHLKKYDPISNSLNTTISLPFNNHVSFQIRYEKQMKKLGAIFTGIGLDHLSNGGFQLPNLGLNYLGVMAGWRASRHWTKPIAETFPKPKIISRWSYGLSWGKAYREFRIPGGPRFPVQILALDVSYHYRQYQLIRLGLEGEQHRLGSYFAAHTELRTDIRSAWALGTRLQVFASHEWLVGRLGLEARLGYQLLQNVVLTNVPLFSRLSVQYYIPLRFLQPIYLATGLALKSHYGTAEYMSVFVTSRYWKKGL